MGAVIAYNPCHKCTNKIMCEMCELKLYRDGVTVQKWIPVSERLPEPTNFVVALTTGGDRIIARLDKYGWLRYGGYETERLRPITHWMPLPEPPKEGP